MYTMTFIFRLFRFRFRHFLVFHFFFIACCALSESDFLLKFKESLQNNNTSSSSSLPLTLATWNLSTTPCSGRRANWVGVLCSQAGRVWGVKLENMSLKGLIDLASLKNLPHLRTLSFMQNDFDGPLPDIGQLGSLKSLYLSDNRFSGAVDSAVFLRMMSLKKLHLARNHLAGRIPVSLALLPKLIELRLEGNRFEGLVPNFGLRTWLSFNLSNNALNGRVPSGLRALNASSFYGNEGLCGEPLKACSTHKSSILSIVVLGVVVLMALSAIGAMIMILCRCRRPCSASIEEPTTQQPVPAASPARSATSRKTDGGGSKLWFVRDDRERFEMPELLSASAEMLGSGSLGSSYKAALGLRPVTVVVKRFKQMNNVGREEFQEHMRRIGGLRHPNVLPLVAFYNKKDEKLLVSDFVENGSLALRLHGGGSEGVGRSLDGRMRLNIVRGVARGLKYLHDELPSVMAAHGHLKASNVLIKDDTCQPLLSDYGLVPLINQEHAQRQMTAYKSPEYLRYGRVTKKTDVWGLGMLILEILTGKKASSCATNEEKEKEKEEDLATWVRSARDQDEVFDRELFLSSDAATMVMMEKLLRIGMECCEADVEKRLDMKEALHKIENLKRDDTTNVAATTSTTSTSDVEDFHSSDLEIRLASFEHEIRPANLSDEFINPTSKEDDT